MGKEDARKKDGTFDKGNTLYRLRKNPGKDKSYTVDEAYDKANNYFEWCDDNPIIKMVTMNTKFGVKKTDEEYNRPYTLEGLCIYMDITTNTFRNWEKQESEIQKRNDLDEEKKKELLESASAYLRFCTRVREIIRNQKYEGAVTGIFKENIIIRDLGYADKQAHTVVVEQPFFPDVEYPDAKH